jgi:uncharacterized protein YjbI with pentapeptide repeats
MKAEDILEKYATGAREFSGSQLSETSLSGATLSGADFSQSRFHRANLSLAKLAGVNFRQVICSQINFTGATLTLADFTRAELSGTNFSKAELTRAKFGGATLQGANFMQADLRDARLRNANLNHTNFSRADLRHAKLTSASLVSANFTSSDLSATDLSGTDLRRAELRQANLSRANLQGANLSGANLRWADLSGADLRWADLSGAKLSGANLTGADLSHATLLDATLVHVDLTRANLASVDWAGADLSGSTLTGVKLYGVSPFGIKTAGTICRWLDLSRNGDQSKIYHFVTDDPNEFFNESPPTVQVVIDDRLSIDANCALAVTYQQIAKHCGRLAPTPSVEVRRRRTILTFKLDQDDLLFLTAYVAIFPFEDSIDTQKNILNLIKRIPTQVFHPDASRLSQFKTMVTDLSQQVQRIQEMKQLQSIPIAIKKIRFFQAPTRTVLMNSNNQSLTLFDHPAFGKRRIVRSRSETEMTALDEQSFEPPNQEDAIAFVKGFHDRTFDIS